MRLIAMQSVKIRVVCLLALIYISHFSKAKSNPKISLLTMLTFFSAVVYILDSIMIGSVLRSSLILTNANPVLNIEASIKIMIAQNKTDVQSDRVFGDWKVKDCSCTLHSIESTNRVEESAPDRPTRPPVRPILPSDLFNRPYFHRLQ